MQTAKNLGEVVKYLIAGVINTVIGYAVFLFFFRVLSVNPELSNALGYAFALGAAYLLNHYFVFSGSVMSKNSIVKFMLAFAIAFLMNQAVLFALYRIFLVRPEIAQIFAMVTYTIVFYFLNKYFVFSFRKQD